MGEVIRNNRFLKLALSFCVLVILLDLCVWYLGRKEYLAFFNIFTSQVITALIHLSGLPATMDINTIYLTNSVWKVTTECTAIFIMIIFTSFILTYPSSLTAKGMALLAGIPFIFVANIGRLYAMAWIDKIRPEFSKFFHNYMWQVVFIMMVIFLWIIWIDKVVNRETKPPVPS